MQYYMYKYYISCSLIEELLTTHFFNIYTYLRVIYTIFLSTKFKTFHGIDEGHCRIAAAIIHCNMKIK